MRIEPTSGGGGNGGSFYHHILLIKVQSQEDLLLMGVVSLGAWATEEAVVAILAPLLFWVLESLRWGCP